MRRLVSASRPHVISGLFFLGAVVFLFRLPLFYGYRFVGNSDRWNHYLSFVRFHADHLAHRQLSAWSEHLLLGLDTFKFVIPTPLYALPALVGSRDVVKVFGYVAPSVLLLALGGAYAVLYWICRDRLAAVAGAGVYALSTFSLLKLSQNDATYVALLIGPPMFYLVAAATRATLVGHTMLLACLVTLGMCFSPQKFSYLIVFLSAYGLYAFVRGRRVPLLALALALPLGTALAVPRLLTLFTSAVGSTRTQSHAPVESIGPLLVFRFFDVDILGRTWREAFVVNNVNLSEVDLLFASMVASLFLAWIVVRGRYTGVVHEAGEARPFRCGFFVAFIVSVFVVIHVHPVYDLFGRLYAGIPFIHSRFAIAALFPIALVTAVNLTREPSWRLTPRRAAIIGAIVLAVLVVGELDFGTLPRALRSLWRKPPPTFTVLPPRSLAFLSDESVSVVTGELRRLIVVATVFAALAVARAMGRLERGSFRTAVALIILGQAVLASDRYLNGPAARSYSMPFEQHDLLMARPGDFQPPTPAQLEALHRRLDNANYRSILLCPETILVQCSSGLGLTWDIRLADGYVAGISPRYASLPWSDGALGLRSIRFVRAPGGDDASAWKLLSLLNVRQAIQVVPELFTNRDRTLPDGLPIVANPSPFVYPRAYFAAEPRSVTRAEATRAIIEHFGPCRSAAAATCQPWLSEKHPTDYVEADVGEAFDASGPLTWRFDGDRADFEFAASSRRRFLVVNEAWDPGWHATVRDQSLTVVPTNVVMRGVVVPEGATHVTMRYDAAVVGTFSWVAALALPLLAVPVSLVMRRRPGPGARVP